MNNNFVKVPHNWFQLNEDGKSYISVLGEKRFTLWFSLNKISAEMNMSKLVPIQIKQISESMKLLNGFCKTSKIKEMMIALKNAELIECKELNKDTKPMDLLYINVASEKHENDCKNGFSTINTQFFKDKINKIDCTGFLIYCFLFKHHNINFGDGMGNYGYAQADRLFICKVLGIGSEKTVTKYIKKIKAAKSLIKIIEQEKYESVNEFGDTEFKWTPNRYIVLAKCDPGNKYYINHKDG